MESFGKYLEDPVDMRILELISNAKDGIVAEDTAQQIISEGYRRKRTGPLPDSIRGYTAQKLIQLEQDGFIVKMQDTSGKSGFRWYVVDEYKDLIKNLMDSYAALDKKLQDHLPYRVKYESVSTLNSIRGHSVIFLLLVANIL